MNPANLVDTTARSMSRTEWHDLYLDHAAGRSVEIVPFPDSEVQLLTNSMSGVETAEHAISIADCIRDCVGAAMPGRGDLTILDYGCGWGRLTRLLPYDYRCVDIVGADVDGRLVRSANSLVPAIRHIKIDNMRPLPFNGGEFDVVVANSVFSHLSERSHRYAISEIQRCLKPGGVAVLSTIDPALLDRCFDDGTSADWLNRTLGEPEDIGRRIDEDGFVWADTGRWDDYGVAVISEEWIDRVWLSTGLEMLDRRRGDHEHSQLFNVARRI